MCRLSNVALTLTRALKEAAFGRHYDTPSQLSLGVRARPSNGVAPALGRQLTALGAASMRMTILFGALALVASPSPLACQASGPAVAAAIVGVIPRPRAALESATEPLAVRDTMAARSSEGSRSRARGARNGLLVGILVGAVAGAAISSDFYDDPGVNVLVGAAAFGALGALLGAAIGARAPGS